MATEDSAGRLPPHRRRSKDQIAEDEVASIYRALGYHVETNVVRGGAQIDVLATKQIPGLGVAVLHIEVKSTERPSLPKGEVEEFVMVAGNLQRAGEAHRSMLVSTANLTPQSKALVAGHPNTFLSTLEELRNELLPVDRGLNLVVLNQRADSRNDLYLDLAVHQVSGTPFEPAITRVSQLSSAARQRAGAAVALLADYGGGKPQRFITSTSRRRVPDSRTRLLRCPSLSNSSAWSPSPSLPTSLPTGSVAALKSTCRPIT